MKRTWAVFDNDISACQGLKLLGRVVSDVRRRLDNFCPAFTMADSLDCTMALGVKKEPNLKLSLSTIRSSRAATMLSSLMHLETGSEHTESYELTTALAKTVQIQQHQNLWTELLTSYGDQLRAFARSPAGHKGLYLVVGIKTARRPDIARSKSEGSEHRVAADTSALEQALGSPIPLSSQVGVEFGHSTTHAAVLASTVAGDRAYAAEYCKLKWTAKGIVLEPRGRLRLRRELVQREVVGFSRKNVAFSGGDEEEEEEEEEDSEGDEDEDEGAAKDVLI